MGEPLALLDRLLGLETEYAIRFSPESDARTPPHQLIYAAVRSAVGSLVSTKPGRMLRDEIFTENGGGFRYESSGLTDCGLIEGGTPECRGPSAALLYQRAQDRLLATALPRAQAELASLGYPGDLGLLKNCRDATGNIYGAQENYDVELARGARLWMWRAGIALLTPLVVLTSAAAWLVTLPVLALVLGLGLVVLVAGTIPAVRRTETFRRLTDAHVPRFPLQRPLELVVAALERALLIPVAMGLLLLVRAVAFRRLRRWLIPLLVSRPAISGAGTLIGDRLHLGEKTGGIHHVIGAVIRSRDRGIIDVGNLCKQLLALRFGQLRPYLRLYRRRQRLQLGLSDSNMCQVAEYLRVAVTALVIDMAESGAPEGGLPRLRDPLAALRDIDADPTLSARVDLAGGGSATALAIQRAYLEIATHFVKASDVPSLEAIELLDQWRAILEVLEREPSSLFGQIDWITKRELIERATGASGAARKKIDLKYHEIGSGYFAALERRGLTRELVTGDAVEEAIRQPPPRSPAIRRGQIIRDERRPVRISWDAARVGGKLGGAVGGELIELDQFRDR